MASTTPFGARRPRIMLPAAKAAPPPAAPPPAAPPPAAAAAVATVAAGQFRYADGPREIRGVAGWRSVSWHDIPPSMVAGRLVVGIQGQTAEWFWGRGPTAEIRIVQYLGGIAEIIFEGAAGSYGNGNSPGSITCEWGTDLIPPDAVEVFARARIGGVADTDTVPSSTETLTVSVVGRFHA